MARRVIQDVVFPSKRIKEEQKNVSGKISTAPPSNSVFIEHHEPHTTIKEPSLVSHSEREQQGDFLPRLIKKPNYGESNAHNINTVSKKSSRSVMWVIALLVLIGMAGVVLSMFFSGATIKIQPLNKTVSVSIEEVIARENATETGVISYQKIPLPAEEMSEDIPATLEKEITKKASGAVKIFNEYDSESQRLIKNTRFESKNGKIYRIDNSVVVPGMSVVGGKTVPGSVEVTVYGDAPGEEYNDGPSDFTIPGFKGDPRYTKFYARSQTPLAGGFSGTIKVPPQEEQNKAMERLKESLRAELIKKARAQIPEGFILYDSVAFVVFDDLESIDPNNPTHITVKGSLYGVMFNTSALSGFIAKKTIDSYDGSPVMVRNLEELDLKPSRDVLDPANVKDIPLTLSGQASVVWDVDSEKLKNELAGVSKKDGFKSIITNYASIWKAEAVIRPFWVMNFPKNPEKITIIEILE